MRPFLEQQKKTPGNKLKKLGNVEILLGRPTPSRRTWPVTRVRALMWKRPNQRFWKTAREYARDEHAQGQDAFATEECGRKGHIHHEDDMTAVTQHRRTERSGASRTDPDRLGGVDCGSCVSSTRAKADHPKAGWDDGLGFFLFFN